MDIFERLKASAGSWLIDRFEAQAAGAAEAANQRSILSASRERRIRSASKREMSGSAVRSVAKFSAAIDGGRE
jgi:hypothetical protein